ncbi:MAG: glutaredoxin domain-containing protein, partial [Alphaproteobacteria bacterium]
MNLKIDIYTGPMCPYCTKAKELLEQKNLTFNELYIGDDIKIMEEMLDRSAGKRTV